MHVVAHRTDMPFVRKLLSRIGEAMPDALRANLRRVEAVDWLQHSLHLLDTLTEGALNDPCMVTNPKTPTAGDIRAVYQNAL